MLKPSHGTDRTALVMGIIGPRNFRCSRTSSVVVCAKSPFYFLNACERCYLCPSYFQRGTSSPILMRFPTQRPLTPYCICMSKKTLVHPYTNRVNNEYTLPSLADWLALWRRRPTSHLPIRPPHRLSVLASNQSSWLALASQRVWKLASCLLLSFHSQGSLC